MTLIFTCYGELTYQQKGTCTFSSSIDPHTSQSDGYKDFNDDEEDNTFTVSISDDEDDAVLIQTVAQLHHCLLINIHIYAIAKDLDIPKLKELAVQKFIDRLGNSDSWPYYQFSKIVAAVLQNTAKDDRGIRSVVQDLLIEHASEIFGPEAQDCVRHREGREEWLAMLRKDADFVLTIWEKTLASKMQM